MDILGPDNAYWNDDEWISWESFGDEEEDRSYLEKLEREAELRLQYPKADIALIPFFRTLLKAAEDYYDQTGQHLQLYGDLGELFGAITYGIKLHRNYAQGSDGRLGDDFIEIKTITPFKAHDTVRVRVSGHFNKLLVVKVNQDFRVSGRLIDRKHLPKTKEKFLFVKWDGLSETE